MHVFIPVSQLITVDGYSQITLSKHDVAWSAVHIYISKSYTYNNFDKNFSAHMILKFSRKLNTVSCSRSRHRPKVRNTNYKYQPCSLMQGKYYEAKI
jgi:hypothetical protein